MSITAEQRDAWVAALRSGQYRQGTGALLTVLPDGGERFCCLGVLAHAVFGLPADCLIGVPLLYHLDHHHHDLSAVMQNHLGSLNDSGVEFAQIADLLEAAGDPTLWA